MLYKVLLKLHHYSFKRAKNIQLGSTIFHETDNRKFGFKKRIEELKQILSGKSHTDINQKNY